jgi:hypothetical protein
MFVLHGGKKWCGMVKSVSVFGDFVSEPTNVSRGVPQGSILKPSFNLYKLPQGQISKITILTIFALPMARKSM